MGGACECLKMLQGSSPQPESSPQQRTPSERRLTQIRQVKEDANEQSVDERKNGISQSSLSQSYRTDAKAFSRRQSTALGSHFGDRKNSSILQSYIDTSSIVIRNPRSTINMGHMDSTEYYTLIDKVAFVKKTADRLKVTTPAGSSELNCQPQYVVSTLFIAQGIPLETLPDVNNQKNFIQTDNSPIKLTLKLNCLECKKKIKLTYCKAYVNLQNMKCPKCDKSGKWGMLDITANVPIWGEGRKIEDHQVLDIAPSQLRLIGCVFCFKFSELSRQLDGCSCSICKNCDFPDQEIVCPICDSDEGML